MVIFIFNIIVIYRSGDFVRYYNEDYQKLGRLRAILKNDNGDYQLRIQKILNYNDLPGNLKGLSRERHSFTGEVWLQEVFLIITTSQILEKVNIIIIFQHQNIFENTLYITEIIYKSNNRWNIRDVKLLYQYPSDYISIR